jgi:hypothetical protein
MGRNKGTAANLLVAVLEMTRQNMKNLNFPFAFSFVAGLVDVLLIGYKVDSNSYPMHW